MATIVDVAKLAGVSTATVSRVLNGQVVSDERVDAVRRAALELQYVPNRAARSLRRRHSEMIALIFPDVSNPYFTEIARGVEDVARAAGYSVVLCNTDGDHAQEAEYLRVAASANMAGVIIAAADDESPAPPIGSGAAVVAIDRALHGADVDEIVMDNYEAGFLASRAIMDRGSIVVLTGSEAVGTARERARGAVDAGAVEVIHADFGVEAGRRYALELIDRAERPGGIIAGNNLLGVGVLQAMAARDLTTRDLAVSVIGALPFTTLHPQAVPIVHLPSRRMGELAAERMLRRISGDAVGLERIVLRGELRDAV